MKSQFPDVCIPDVTLHKVILDKADQFSDRVALVNGITHESFTYDEMKSLVLRVASALSERGLKKGDTLAIFMTNCPEFAIFMLGTMCLGVTITLVNPKYTKDEICEQLKDSNAIYVFTSEDLVDKARDAASEIKPIKEIFVLGEAPGCTSYTSLTRFPGTPCIFSTIHFNPSEDVVFLPYSSGTTGLPKGVMLTHINMLTNIFLSSKNIFPAAPNAPRDVLLGILPLYHIYGLAWLCSQLAYGATIITVPKFQPRLFLQLIEKYKVTSLALVPPLVLFLIQSPLTEEYDLSSLNLIASGAAPLGIDQQEALARKFRSVVIRQGYGLTETSPLVTVHIPGKIKPGSVGMATPNTETQVVDTATGQELGPHAVGELWIRGPQVMKGYLNQPDETRRMLDEDGWLHTGDLAYYDEDKNFFIVDRIKELIKYKGTQVAPAELEALLLTHPDIDDVGVTSVPDPDAGELPFAFIVKKPGSSLSEADVQAFVTGKVASYKQLRGGVRFVEEIPKNNTGKILRRVLRDLARKECRQSKL